MENMLAPYECQFSADERKALIAATLAMVRKDKGYSQKEVAAWIGISQATYSAYERGRNEPPAEILVRLSYLYACRVDDLIQRDRLKKDYNGVQDMVDDLRAQVARYEELMSRHGGVSPEMRSLVDELAVLLDRTEKLENE